MDRIVYADNAATTKVSEAALNAMLPYLKEEYGNPSSIYSLGRNARAAVEKAREQVAKALNADLAEIYFTSCGTESINWAIKGAAHEMAKKGKKHIISSVIEHHAVLHSLDELKKEGFEVTLLPVDETGLVSVEDVKNAISDQTALITIMTANNEIGTVQPIEEIGKVAKENGILFHTDSVQAMGHMEVDVKKFSCDMLSLSGHKFHAPKGIGVMYMRKGLKIPNFMQGGAQERNKRGGTENVAGIVALGQAIEDITNNLEKNNEYVKKLSEKLIDGVMKIPFTKFNGNLEKKLPGTNNFSFSYIEGESLLLLLDMNGICASSGSACTSGSLDPSHVLLALGLPHETAHGSLRLSINHYNTMEDIDYILEKLPGIVERLRAMSPLYEEAMKNK